MDHQFAAYPLVKELVERLGLPATNPEVYIDALNKNKNLSAVKQMNVSDAKKKILAVSKKATAFVEKYDDLKSKNIRELDNFVCLISRLLDDKQVIDLLEKSSLTQTEVVTIEQIQAEIYKATSSNSTLTSTSFRKDVSNVLKKLNFPTFPEWVRKRPSLSLDFSPEIIGAPFMEDVKNIPVITQEKILIEDLLYCCEGIEGRFIRCEPISRSNDVRKFKIDPRLDKSLIKMAERILPLSSMYSCVVRFIERKYDFKHGLVNQALVAAITSIMKEYDLLIARLEHQQRSGSLTLQKFWFYIQTTMHTMGVLSSVIRSIHDSCRGGSVLSVLHENTLSNTGDAKAQKLCFHLTQAACVPYFEILENWIYKGIISDPYFEFMVQENDGIHKENLGEDYNDTYWEKKYTLQLENTPVFLEKMATKILKTGKYLNVVRECGRDVCCPAAESLEYDLNENQFIDKIENAIQYSSSLLLDVLMREMDLMTRLRSIKHYFLLDQGDFIVQFMDMTKHEMKKKMEDIHLPRLETLLELALRSSTANADPYKDDLKVNLLSIDLVSQLFKILSIETKQEKDYRNNSIDLNLSGLESFSFDYVVRWPVSLVLNRKALAKYQILSRHLFYCKHVERQLCNVWVSDKSLKNLMSKMTLGARAYTLRQRMLNFVQNFEYYFMLEVIEPYWQLFESNMSKVTNVDEVLSHHEELLNNCLKDSMLTDDSLLRTHCKLMATCVTFHNFMQKLNASFMPTKSYMSSSKVTTEDKKIAMEVLSEHVDDILRNESYEKIISTIEESFAREFVTLQEKIIKLSEKSSDHKLGNIILRLDFNGFYKNHLEKLSSERNKTPFFKSLQSAT